ncbi:DISARM system helicase DrmA [Nodosilinea sp. PGN35]|uniref:DISARM system helicase DrmA n=1 Tax=Nodosilinea sp. PGN35 TaxID=3020489 RepID=UPI0023B2D41D|nr:DISARM system helicase DrmA [Nodosilinea sp. TSF1-S3]MDF0366097.1 DISARM system helicase DrmA [Nodosilinea sp. TSF1-S3]
MTTSADIRATLVDALNIDLVGPTPHDTDHAEEILRQAPSKWYLTGFLAPFGAPPDLRSDDDADDDLPEEVTTSDSSEDSKTPDKPAARKALFPSSMGLSCLLSGKTTTLEAQVTWGDYIPLTPAEDDPEEGQGKSKRKKKPEHWQRVPQQATLTVPIEERPEPFAIDIPGGSGLNLVVTCRPVLDDRFPYGTKAVSVFLVNYRQVTSGDRDATFAFQTHLNICCTEGFVPRPDPRGVSTDDWDEAVAALQYRDDYEFAVGHNVSALAIDAEGSHCTEVCTTWIPIAEVPRVAPTAPKGVQLGMESLALAPNAATIRGMVGPLVTEYRAWIATQRAVAISPQEAANVARDLLDRASRVCDRIEAGLNALADPQVLEAFQVANRAIATARRRQLSQEESQPPESFPEPTWRPFQLAFILLNLVGLADPIHDDRKTVDLLFFPTGGGKTEAYLGLAAFTLILRRLKYPGIQAAGMSVLMRYTLRLLTLDQLERASRLICALELERQKVPDKLGTWPFEIGLWVGQGATPNRMGKRGDKDEYSARERTLDFKRDSKSKPSPIPLERCPWCGEGFNTNSFQLLPTEDAPKTLKIVCVNRSCDFRSRNPLPILAVDEPIYRRLPCFIIATVDKFAALPWVGQTGALFGHITHYQDGEGFYSPGDSTIAGRPLEGYLPPPDLIIQDELHLISGPLGTMVGLYETAIDTLCCREENGHTIRPKVIASTATVRRASRQIQALFGRSQVDIFPPPGPDRHDSFFAKTDSKAPGRLYVGVAAQGRSLKVILLRVYLALLAAAQKQWVEAGGKRNKNNPSDPYMTLMGYFNSLRELGGSRRIVEDEVNSRLTKYSDRLREGELVGPFLDRKIDEMPEELTSRVSTNKIANTKRRLSTPFHEDDRVDVALATNMISVGLDIIRLGLMVVLGQPKTAAEYIQATSRVGRDKNKPGLVVTLMNIHRPRDRSHYERFESWHNSFYRAVEATSVTPFSPRALDRGLAGVMVALARLGVPAMTSPMGASNLTDQRAAVAAMVEAIARRAEGHSPDLDGEAANDLRVRVRSQVTDLLDTWERILTRETRLQYQKETDLAPALLVDALDLSAEKRPADEQKFKTQRSLRDVEASVNLWIRDPYTMEGVAGDDE